MKKIYALAALCITFICCNKEGDSNLNSVARTDSMSLTLSKHPEFTNMANLSAATLKFHHFAALDSVAPKISKIISKPVYLKQVPDSEISRITNENCEEQSWATAAALVTFSAEEPEIILESDPFPGFNTFYVDAVVKTLNPFFSYVIRYKLVQDSFIGTLSSSDHTVHTTGLNICNMSISNVQGFDTSATFRVCDTKVNWTVSMGFSGITLDVDLEKTIKVNVP